MRGQAAGGLARALNNRLQERTARLRSTKSKIASPRLPGSPPRMTSSPEWGCPERAKLDAISDLDAALAAHAKRLLCRRFRERNSVTLDEARAASSARDGSVCSGGSLPPMANYIPRAFEMNAPRAMSPATGISALHPVPPEGSSLARPCGCQGLGHTPGHRTRPARGVTAPRSCSQKRERMTR